MVLWIGVYIFATAAPVLIPGLGTKTPHQATECRSGKKKKKNLEFRSCMASGLTFLGFSYFPCGTAHREKVRIMRLMCCLLR